MCVPCSLQWLQTVISLGEASLIVVDVKPNVKWLPRFQYYLAGLSDPIRSSVFIPEGSRKDRAPAGAVSALPFPCCCLDVGTFSLLS